MLDAISSSDSLLTEILELLHQLNFSVEEVSKRLAILETEVSSIKQQVEKVITNGFQNGDLDGHRKWHEGNWLQRILLKR